MVLKQLSTHKEHKSQLTPHTFTKINLKSTTDLNIKAKTSDSSRKHWPSYTQKILGKRKTNQKGKIKGPHQTYKLLFENDKKWHRPRENTHNIVIRHRCIHQTIKIVLITQS